MFLSPPWGGPQYLEDELFDLKGINGYEIIESARKVSRNLAVLLPRNSDLRQLLELAGPSGSCEVEKNYLNGKVKTLTVYFGDIIKG